MRKSTCARLMLVSFGLNMVGLFVGVIAKAWGYVGFHAILLWLCERWICKEYFDKEEEDAGDRDQ